MVADRVVADLVPIVDTQKSYVTIMQRKTHEVNRNYEKMKQNHIKMKQINIEWDVCKWYNDFRQSRSMDFCPIK